MGTIISLLNYVLTTIAVCTAVDWILLTLSTKLYM